MPYLSNSPSSEAPMPLTSRGSLARTALQSCRTPTARYWWYANKLQDQRTIADGRPLSANCVALRGLLLLAFPGTFVSLANSMIGAETWWRASDIAFALVGVYLTYVGWAPARSRAASRPASSTSDLPRAA
jgi:hypothetical protein